MLTTPDRQSQQEYIITEEQLTNLILDLEYRRYNLARITQDQIRSRPAPTLEEPEITDKMFVFAIDRVYKKGMKDGAKATREKVLDDLIMWMYDCPFGGREGSDRCHRILAYKIESLQQQGGDP
jgi:hypothetical protein